MTTIAVSRMLRMMASDSSVTVGDVRVPTFPKLFRERGYIVGCGGHVANFKPFVQWLRDGRDSRMPAGVSALLLYRDGRIGWFSESTIEHMIPDDHFAIGSGASFALGALDTLHDMGLPPDPRTAVRAACRRDTNSAEPILSLRWKTKGTR